MKSIYVGNLDPSAKEQDIRSLFEVHGVVQRVYINTSQIPGQSRGFAFVEMPDDEQADKAIAALVGTRLAGRDLHIVEARPREDRPTGLPTKRQ